MAGYPMLRSLFAQRRLYLTADLHRERTARVKPTTRWRIDWARHIAGEHEPVPPSANLGDEHG
jgi:hypothetical protein